MLAVSIDEICNVYFWFLFVNYESYGKFDSFFHFHAKLKIIISQCYSKNLRKLFKNFGWHFKHRSKKTAKIYLHPKNKQLFQKCMNEF